MELHPTPFPVKSQYLKTKPSRNITEASKPNLKGAPPLLRPKRVFGISRNPNLILKPDPQNPKPKPSTKSTKPSQTTQKKKTVCFKENLGDNNGKFLGDESVMELQTPVKVLAKATDSFTPYKSAERCSKCRFDRLETSAYWLGQIKLAESVGKHFVSASFFQLAFDCKAEVCIQ
ncbi:hypothetical protein ACJIZ3_017970 [Penstemon smallii]|uniref:Uncharacterized protein n=1 Tax=Penstemon smallii TaxID=265156 RepID=A0ABD3SY74_9LAMI